jgi:putative N6-adenine-specific DNA methylase
MIIMNPPYGERLEEKLDMDKFYHDIGFRLKHNYPDHTAWIISSNLDAMKRLGLKPDLRIKLFNGQLECRYNKYSLFKGKRIDQLKAAHS